MAQFIAYSIGVFLAVIILLVIILLVAKKYLSPITAIKCSTFLRATT